MAHRLSMAWERQAETAEFQSRAKDHPGVLETDLQGANNVLETMRACFDTAERPVARAGFARC